MKFAEHLSAHITPEWRKQYISYEVSTEPAGGGWVNSTGDSSLVRVHGDGDGGGGAEKEEEKEKNKLTVIRRKCEAR